MKGKVVIDKMVDIYYDVKKLPKLGKLAIGLGVGLGYYAAKYYYLKRQYDKYLDEDSSFDMIFESIDAIEDKIADLRYDLLHEGKPGSNMIKKFGLEHMFEKEDKEDEE